MGFFQKILGADSVTNLGVRAKWGGGDATHGVAQVTGYPMYLGATDGAYSLGLQSGTMAAGLSANSEIFQFRWTATSSVCVVRGVYLSATVAGTAFAAGAARFNLIFARSWSADGSGGNGATLTTDNCKKRTDFSITELGAARVSSTAALTVGTKTLDATALGSIVGVSGTATTGQIVPPGTALWKRDTPEEYPLLLDGTEGLVIRADVPGTGTWGFAVTVEWAEVEASSF